DRPIMSNDHASINHFSRIRYSSIIFPGYDIAEGQPASRSTRRCVPHRVTQGGLKDPPSPVVRVKRHRVGNLTSSAHWPSLFSTSPCCSDQRNHRVCPSPASSSRPVRGSSLTR